jgi:hypothetical protein
MRTHVFATRFGIGLVAALAAIAILPALAAPAAAGPVTASAATPQWAYGGERNIWINVSSNGTQMSIHSFASVHVLLTQTNTSSTTFRLELQRVMDVGFYAKFCRPSCADPIVSGNVSVAGWERGTAYANLTRAGSVDVAGAGPTAAIALMDASSQSRANMTGHMWLNTSGPLGSHKGSAYIAAESDASLSASFSPALGLVPGTPYVGEHWNASAAYTSAGAYSVEYVWAHSTVNGAPVSGDGSRSGNATGHGAAVLYGADLATIKLADGRTVPVIVYRLVGPDFSVKEGMLLVPGGADIYGSGTGGAATLSAQSPVMASVSTDQLDLDPSAAVGHFGLLASSSGISPQSAMALGSPTILRQMGPGASNAPALGLPGGSELQAQPESVATAECALGGACVSSGPAHGLPIGLLALGIALIAGIALVTLVASRRRSPKSPAGATTVYPTPAVSLAPAVAPPPREGVGSTAGETSGGTDPLGHLW